MPSNAGAIDLSALKSKTPEPEAPSLADLSDEEIAALAALGEDVEPEDDRTPVTTGFLVFQTTDGGWQAHADLAVVDTINLERPATPDDFTAGASNIIKDITSMTTAQHVMAAMQQQAQMAMKMQQEQAARQQAMGLKNLRA